MEHLHPEFKARVERACTETGAKVLSAARTRARQQELFDLAQQGGRAANRPGTSWHEFGDGLKGGPSACAVDFVSTRGERRRALLEVRSRADEFGLCFPVPKEIWHAQPIEITVSSRFAGAELLVVSSPSVFNAEELPMEFTYVFANQDFLWLGAERIHAVCGSADVLEGLKKNRQIVGLGPQSDEFHKFLTDIAKNARFTG